MLSLGTSLTNQNAAAVLRDGLARVAQGDVQVDCTGLTQVDSAAVAVLLAWHRAAAARNLALSLRGVPADLSQLASLYGVDGLLGLTPGAARAKAPEAESDIELAFAQPGQQPGHHHRH